jgi:hypothetical protein
MRIVGSGLAGVGGALLALGLPAPASAGVTMGGPGTGSTITETCPTAQGCVLAVEALPGRVVAAPFDGVVVRYRIRAQGASRLYVLRYVGDDTVVRQASGPTLPVSAPAALTAFPVRIPIAEGDHLGAWVAGQTTIFGREVAGADLDIFSPAPDLLTPTAPPEAGQRDQQGEVAFNADVEPDADHDGYGDETQDLCPTDGGTHVACPQPVVALGPRAVLTATPGGRVPVSVGCRSASAHCTGQIALEMTVHVRRARVPAHPRVGTDARHLRRRVNLRLTGRRRFSFRSGRPRRVTLELLASARRRLASCGRLGVRVVVARPSATGRPVTTKVRAVLRSASDTRPRRRSTRRHACW